MSFEALPSELVVCIAESSINQQSINALARTSRHNYQLLNVYLYKYNIQHRRGWALFWAAWHGRKATARHMIKAGARLDQRYGERKETALLWAAQSGQVEMVTFLMESGADPKLRDSRGYTAMQWAIETDQVPLARLLMDKGMNLHDTCKERIYEGGTALHVASHMGYHAMMKLLLDLGFDVDARDDEGSTPLHWAVYENDQIFQFFGKRREWNYEHNVATVRLLLDHNADLGIRNNHRESPKDQVREYSFNKKMQHLFDDGSVLFDKNFSHTQPHLRPPSIKDQGAND